jgi:hypothetical protein
LADALDLGSNDSICMIPQPTEKPYNILSRRRRCTAL